MFSLNPIWILQLNGWLNLSFLHLKTRVLIILAWPIPAQAILLPDAHSQLPQPQNKGAKSLNPAMLFYTYSHFWVWKKCNSKLNWQTTCCFFMPAALFWSLLRPALILVDKFGQLRRQTNRRFRFNNQTCARNSYARSKQMITKCMSLQAYQYQV